MNKSRLSNDHRARAAFLAISLLRSFDNLRVRPDRFASNCALRFFFFTRPLPTTPPMLCARHFSLHPAYPPCYRFPMSDVIIRQHLPQGWDFLQSYADSSLTKVERLRKADLARIRLLQQLTPPPTKSRSEIGLPELAPDPRKPSPQGGQKLSHIEVT